MRKPSGPPVFRTQAIRVARSGNDTAAALPPAYVAAALMRPDGAGAPPPSEQARLYADFLAEADRLRRKADDALLRGMIAPRDPRP